MFNVDFWPREDNIFLSFNNRQISLGGIRVIERMYYLTLIYHAVGGGGWGEAFVDVLAWHDVLFDVGGRFDAHYELDVGSLAGERFFER